MLSYSISAFVVELDYSLGLFSYSLEVLAELILEDCRLFKSDFIELGSNIFKYQSTMYNISSYQYMEHH